MADEPANTGGARCVPSLRIDPIHQRGQDEARAQDAVQRREANVDAEELRCAKLRVLREFLPIVAKVIPVDAPKPVPAPSPMVVPAPKPVMAAVSAPDWSTLQHAVRGTKQ